MTIYKCTYFGIKELVSPVVYNKWGEQAWMFFNETFLQDLDFIRDSWKFPIIINNWASGLKQCGLRSNLDDMVLDKSRKDQLYLSAHTMGKAVDLHDKLGRNQKLYDHVYNLLKNNKLKSIKRLENYKNTPGWVHVDTFNSCTYIF